MIVGGHPRSLEFVRFGRPNLTERDTHFHAELAHFPHDLENAVELFRAVAYAPPGRTHAESGRALCAGPFCRDSNRFDRQ